MNSRRIMLAATKSGSGKTTITCALLCALKERGLNVKSFKCGPDYIDPMFHKKVLGIESKNLDLYFTDEERTRELFALNNDSDISVIEGVMGLYDGLGGISEKASSYHLASVLECPIILIIDGQGMGRSILAEVAGFISMDTHKLIKGIIINRISRGMFDSLKEKIEKEFSINVIGFIPKLKTAVFSSRHLGLVLPDEIDNLNDKISEASGVLLENINIEKLLDLSLDGEFSKDNKKCENAEIVAAKEEGFCEEKIRIAIALDEAFCFYYEDNIRLLQNNGAELIPFSPLHDTVLPDGISGIILGGGYPELYAKELSSNSGMLKSVKEAFDNKMPFIAECGGFMYLHKSMTIKEGETYNLAGAIDAECYYTDHLVRFGYINLEKEDNNENYFPVKGHEFHYFESTGNGDNLKATKPVGKRSYKCCHLGNNYLIGFPHLYYPSNPEFPKWFVGKCREYRCEL